MGLIYPDWPAPVQVGSFRPPVRVVKSLGVFAGFNLGAHVADDPCGGGSNRHQLRELLHLSQEPVWLNQVHGTVVYPVIPRSRHKPHSPHGRCRGDTIARRGLDGHDG